MKKLLLSLATLLCGAGAWADVTDLPELSTAENPVYYVIHNTRSASGGLIYFDGTTIKDANPNAVEDKYKFYFTGSDYNNVKIHNAAAGNKMLVNYNTWDETGANCAIEVTPHSSKAGLAIKFGSGDEEYLNEANYGDTYTWWSADDDGSIFVIEKVEDFPMPKSGNTYLVEVPLFIKAQWNMKGLTHSTDATAPTWSSVVPSNENYQWIVSVNESGIALQNKATQKYLNGTTMSDEPAYGNIKYLGFGRFNIVINGTTIHAAGHNSGAGANGDIVTWAGGANTASAWQFIKAGDSEEYAKAFLDAITVPVTTDDANPKYFPINSGRGDDRWYTYTPDDGQIALQAFTGADTQLWYFKATVVDGNVFLQLFPKTGNGMAMSYENTSNGANKIVAKELGTEGWTNTWKLLSNSGEAPYRLQTNDAANYLSNYGGVANNMGLWDGTPTTDTGTLMYIHTPETMYSKLMSTVSLAEAMTSANAFGYYKSNDTFLTKLNNAKSLAQTASVYKSFTVMKELEAEIANLEQILPGAGFYRIIKDAGTDDAACLISGTSGQTTFKTGETENISSIFYYDGNKLVSYDNGLYVHNGGTNFMNYTTTVGEGVKIEFESDYRMEGKCFVKFPAGTAETCTRYLYCGTLTDGQATSNAGSSVNVNTTDQGYRFTVEPVTWLPVPMNTEVGYATVYSPVELGLYGRVEAYTAEANTETASVKLTSQTVVPANTGVVLKLTEGAETRDNCVFLPVQETTVTDVASALQGSLADEYVTPETGTTCYVLSKPENKDIAFYRAALNQNENTAFLNNGFKAYLPVANTAAARFAFDFGTETGIENIEGAETGSTGNAAIYDLSGRRVKSAQKGIYIVNGKKVIK